MATDKDGEDSAVEEEEEEEEEEEARAGEGKIGGEAASVAVAATELITAV